MRGLALGQDVVDVARVAALAALGVGDLVRPDQPGRVAAAARGRADPELEVGHRLDPVVALPGHVDGGGLFALERAHAFSDRA